MEKKPESTSAVLAQTYHSISLAAARTVITAALQTAAQHGWHISVAVVDRAGELVSLDRSDAAIGISPSVAQGKAHTAALLRAPSKEFESFINSGSPSFLATPGVTPLEGGIPLWFHGEVIGAVGVSGAHGANDSLVAEQAAEALASF